MLKNVRDLYVDCSLKVINLDSPYTAMSDCCRNHAVAAVVMENGSKMWRCTYHKDIQTGMPFTTGNYVTAVEIKE